MPASGETRIIINSPFHPANYFRKPAPMPATPAPSTDLQVAHLQLENIRVGYQLGQQMHEIVHSLSFALQRGEIGCLLGQSGCGKTTVLRAIAGFESLIAGRIVLGGKELSNAQHTTVPEARHVGVVFQDYALFPHLSVADNIGLSLIHI